MERIGIAASKIAQGNLILYNVFVILISLLFTLLIFFISGFSILAALYLIAVVTQKSIGPEINSDWKGIVRMCFVSLAVVVGVFNLLAVLKNIKVRL